MSGIADAADPHPGVTVDLDIPCAETLLEVDNARHTTGLDSSQSSGQDTDILFLPAEAAFSDASEITFATIRITKSPDGRRCKSVAEA